MQKAGVSWLRIDADWSNVERVKSEYEFDDLDKFLSQADTLHCRVILILDGENRIYGKGPPRTDVAVRAFIACAQALLQRYRGRGILWELWPEANSGVPTPRLSPVEYTRLAFRLGAVRDRIAPQDAIIGLGTAGFDWSYISSCFGLGILRVIDAVGIHAYGQVESDDALPYWKRLKDLVDHYKPVGRRIACVSSEWGWPSSNERGGPDRQAEYASRMLLSNLMSGIPLTIWYDWCDDPAPVMDDETANGLVHPHGDSEIPKPSYEAYAALNRQLRGFAYRMRLATSSSRDYLVLFSRGSELKLVMWTSGQPHQLHAPLRVAGDDQEININNLPQVATLNLRDVDRRAVLGWPSLPLFSPERDLSRVLKGDGSTDHTDTAALLNNYSVPRIPVEVDTAFAKRSRQTVFDEICEGASIYAVTSLKLSDGTELRQVSRPDLESGPPFEFIPTPTGLFPISRDSHLKLHAQSINHFAKPRNSYEPWPIESEFEVGFTYTSHRPSLKHTIQIARAKLDSSSLSDGRLDVQRVGDEKPPCQLRARSMPTSLSSGKGRAIQIEYSLGSPGRCGITLRTGGEYASPIRGRPLAVGMWIRSDGKGQPFHCRLVDQDGQVLAYSLGQLNHRGWTWVSADLTRKPDRFWNGKRDGRIHGKVWWETIAIIDTGFIGARSDTICIADPVILVAPNG